MDNRIVTLMLALGLSPAAFAKGEYRSLPNGTGSNFSVAINNLKLHFQTKLILQKLKEQGALSLVDSTDGAQLVIHGDRLDDQFYGFIRELKNVKKSDQGMDLVVSDGLAAALSKFGELNELSNSARDEQLLEDLQNKMGTDLPMVLAEGSAGSFA